MILKRYTLFILPLLVLFYCKKTTESKLDLGNADFSSFVSLGNSLTAGVSDGGLYEEAQKNSFPNLIAKMVEVDKFEQPIMSGNGFGFTDEDGRLSLNLSTFSIDVLAPGSEKNRNLNRAYNNLGIPLIRAEQMYTSTTSVQADTNHFVDKILRGSGRTAIHEALSLNPTILTLWVGNNDVLEAAALGMADENRQYTSKEEFTTHFNNIINELTANTNAPIYVANIFDITDLPYFTSLPPSVVSGGNKTYLFGDCENGVRQLTDDDLLLFWALPDYFGFLTLPNTISANTALNDTLILDREEVQEIQNVIDDYNDIIQNSVNSNSQLHLVDIHSLFKSIENNGYDFDGTNYSNNLIEFTEEGFIDINPLQSTLFSIDGLHPRGFGYAAIANSFISKINNTQNANIPLVEASDL